MKADIQTITFKHPAYPVALKNIIDPPARLYARGNLAILSHPHLLAVVGSRRANTYGQHCIQAILPPLPAAGIVIVSGLAFGIDALAHAVAVKAGKPTIAVLGSGIDDASIYPRAHVRLANQIILQGGAVISEYAEGTPTYPGNFPARNRIIAGLCPATLLIQANMRSGSLITARLALEDGRDVCAVPGPLTDPLCEGTNDLLKQGAITVTNADDLLLLFQLTSPETPPSDLTFSFEQAQLLQYLSAEPKHVDDLVTTTKLPIQIISALLTELELLGIVAAVGGLKYVKKNREKSGFA